MTGFPRWAAPHPWQDAGLPVPERVERLLAEMTLEEKVAQLGSRWIGHEPPGDADAGSTEQEPGEGDVAPQHNVAPMEDVFRRAGRHHWKMPHGTGSASSPGSTAALPCRAARVRPS